MPKIQTTLVLMMALLFLGGTCQGQGVPTDARLQKRIALPLSEYGVSGRSLENILQQYSERSAVDVAPQPKRGVPAVRLVVDLPDVPLDDAMQALSSFFSYRGAVSRWESVEGDPAKYRFALSTHFGENLLTKQYWIRRQYAFLKTILSHADDSPAQQENLKDDKTLYFAVKDTIGIKAIKLMVRSFDEETILQILAGETSPRLHVSDLDKEARGLARDVLTFNAQYTKQTVEAGCLQFTARNGSSVLPDVWVISPYKNIDRHGAGSTILGPLEWDCMREIWEFWRVKGDTASEAVPEAKTLTRLDTVSNFSDLLLKISKETNTPVLACIPTGNMPGFDRLKPDMTLGAVLQQLSRSSYITYKWHRGILLMAPPQLFTGEIPLVKAPPGVIEALERLQATDKDHLLYLTDMVELTRPLSTEQLTVLAQDFNFLLVVRRFRPLMRWLERHPEAGTALKQGQGIPVTRSLYTALNAIDADLNRLTAGRPMAETKLPKAELFWEEEWGTLPGYFPKEIPAELVRARDVRLILKDPTGAILRKWTDLHFVSRDLPNSSATPETH